MNRICVQHPNLADTAVAAFAAALQAEPDVRSESVAIWHQGLAGPEIIRPLAERHGVDAACLPADSRLADYRLLAFDMDSTLITVECVDEIADFAGLKAEVAAITEAAMRGEIADYTESLRRRVALLAGLPESVLDTVYRERVRLSPGAEALVAAARQQGLKILLVSGGFTFFTARLAERLGFDAHRSNTLEIVDGKITGRVPGDIVDGECKRQTVLAMCAENGFEPNRAIVIGDGSNDLPMMSVAGLSVAYRAKPAVRAQASQRIDHGGLDSALNWFYQS